MAVIVVKCIDELVVDAIHACGPYAGLIGPLIHRGDEGAEGVPEGPEEIEYNRTERVIRFED